jgi:hypothetical protein
MARCRCRQAEFAGPLLVALPLRRERGKSRPLTPLPHRSRPYNEPEHLDLYHRSASIPFLRPLSAPLQVSLRAVGLVLNSRDSTKEQ